MDSIEALLRNDQERHDLRLIANVRLLVKEVFHNALDIMANRLHDVYIKSCLIML